MNGRNISGWKAAALPLVAVTAGLALGINYFIGGARQDSGPSSASADFKFDSGPKYAPGTAPSARTGAQGGSSIEMFQKVNANYSKETAQATPGASAKPGTRAEAEGFASQARHDVNYDQAAQAAAAGQGGPAQGQGRAGGNYSAGANGKTQAAAQALAGAKSAGATPRLKPSGAGLSSGKSSFAAGFRGASSARGGAGASRLQAYAQGAEGESGDYGSGGGGETGAGSGGGNGLNAGAYGSHGGGSSAAAQSTGAGAAGGMSKASKEPKPVPMPVSFIWPRSFDFGDMYAYETAARQVIVMNIGDATLNVGKIENMDTEMPFTLEKDKCTSAKLAPGKTCTFKVRFSPKAIREYRTGFSIGTNDEGAINYQSAIEVKGNAKYSSWTWVGYSRRDRGYTNRLSFGMVPEGYSMDETLLVANNSGQNWHSVKLDRSKLPASFKISGDGCSGKDLAPRQSCPVTVSFVPNASTNRQFSSSHYGQYNAARINDGAKEYSARPHFPPLVMDSPVEAAPQGELRVFADYKLRYSSNALMLSVPISAKSCAPFPVPGLARLQHYYYFK